MLNPFSEYVCWQLTKGAKITVEATGVYVKKLYFRSSHLRATTLNINY